MKVLFGIFVVFIVFFGFLCFFGVFFFGGGRGGGLGFGWLWPCIVCLKTISSWDLRTLSEDSWI